MWEIAFEESMLDTHENLIIHCPCKDLAEDLMEVLEKNGVVWCGDEPPTSNTKWSENAEDTCYWVESKCCSIAKSSMLMKTQMENMESIPDAHSTV